jgi:DNA invertase Pin-like site-specific DNA recombinase
MTSKNEPAGIWLRVSTGQQDEADQEPQVLQHCRDRRYRIEREYRLNDKSAYKGEQEEAQRQVIEDVRHGVIKILVCWHSNRLERRGGRALLNFLGEVADAGGRVESFQEPELGGVNMGGQIMTFVSGVMAYEYSKNISDNVKKAFDGMKADKALIGRRSFGLVIAGSRKHKTLVPDETVIREVDGKPKPYAVDIFERIADGQSLMTVAQWLDSQGVPTVSGAAHWSPKSVSQIIRNYAYIGQRKAVRWPKVGPTLVEFEPLVESDLFIKANKRLDNAPRGRRGPATHEPALLTGALRCGNCHAPMYRVFSGYGASRKPYYRCAGKLPQRHGCGQMVLLSWLDAEVDDMMQVNETWVYRDVFVPGDDEKLKVRLADVQLKIRELGTKDLTDDEYDAELGRLRAERDDIREAMKHAAPEHWDSVPLVADDGHIVTHADLWRATDLDGKRRILKDIRVSFMWDELPDEPGRFPRIGVWPRTGPLAPAED